MDAAYLTTLLEPQPKRCQNTENSEVAGLRKERKSSGLNQDIIQILYRYYTDIIQILYRYYTDIILKGHTKFTIVSIRLSIILVTASSVL